MGNSREMTLDEMLAEAEEAAKKGYPNKKTLAELAKEKKLKQQAEEIRKRREEERQKKKPSIGKQINFPRVTK